MFHPSIASSGQPKAACACACLVPGTMEVTCSETPAICLVDPHAVTQWTRVSAQGLETRWVNEHSLADVATVFQMSRDAFQKSSLS